MNEKGEGGEDGMRKEEKGGDEDGCKREEKRRGGGRQGSLEIKIKGRRREKKRVESGERKDENR